MPDRSAASGVPERARHLRREVIGALVLKAILLGAIYVLCFGGAHQPRSDAEATAVAVTGAQPAKHSR